MRHKSAIGILILTVSLAPNRPVSAQALSAEERQIAAAVDEQIDEAYAFLERIVNIESATQNVDGVRRVGEVFRQELDALGFTTTWTDMPAEMKRAGHLVGHHQGSRGKRLLILGHLDNVLQGERFVRTGTTARGSGVSDMKGGDVVLLFALKSLQRIGALDERRVRVVLTGDEEDPGEPVSVSRAELMEAAKQSDVALSFEQTIRNTATVARRGFSSWTLEVSGSTGHSGGLFGPDRGSGAVFEVARILNAFHDQLRGQPYLTFNPSVIVGGTDVDFTDDHGSATGKLNVVAQRVVVRGDLRFISEEQKELTRATMRAIVARHLPKTSATIAFQDANPAVPPTEEATQLLHQLDQVSRDLGGEGVEALDAAERGGGDMSFTGPFVAGLDGLGMRGQGAHAPGESADLASLPMLIKRAAILMYRLTR